MNKITAKAILGELLEAYDACEHGDYFYDHGDSVCNAVECVLREQDGKDTNVPTNADHIRSMTDEELAKLLLNGNVSDVCPNGCDTCDGDCDKRMLDWLKQPYKEET